MTQGFVPSGLVKHSSRTVNECLIVLDRGAGVVGLELGLVRASGARESNIKSVRKPDRQIGGRVYPGHR